MPAPSTKQQAKKGGPEAKEGRRRKKTKQNKTTIIVVLASASALLFLFEERQKKKERKDFVWFSFLLPPLSLVSVAQTKQTNKTIILVCEHIYYGVPFLSQ